MKFRNGFVSNSSSSSFLIAIKEKLSQAALRRALDLQENSVVNNFIAPIIAFLAKKGDETTIKDLLLERYYNNEEQLPKRERDLFQDGWYVYKVSVSNEEEGVSAMLYDGQSLCAVNTDKIKMVWTDF